MEKIHEQETQLEHDPIIKEEISWKTAVAKVEIVLNDVCREYEKDGQTKTSLSLNVQSLGFGSAPKDAEGQSATNSTTITDNDLDDEIPF